VQDVHAILPIGTVIRDRYNVIALLGKGGYGAVYLVRDQRVRGNLFALKEMIDTSKQERARFAIECELLKRLDHPSLPRVYHSFEDQKSNRSYMLMDYIEGSNLEKLRRKQPQKGFPLEQVLTMMAPIDEAISYLHQQQPPIIHRDIKPANIIVPDSGDQTVLVDFGIAKEFDPDSTTTIVRRCSPGYGAPEQYDRGTNTRTDIYGLGATVYTLLTGSVPDDAFYRMMNVGSGNGDPLEPAKQRNASIPDHVSTAIQRAMSINIEERFPTAEQFWQALHASPSQRNAPMPLVLPQASSVNESASPAHVIPAMDAASAAPLAANKVTHDTISSLTTQNQWTREHTIKSRPLPILLAFLALVLAVALVVAYWPTITGHQANTTTPTPATQHRAAQTAKPTPASTATPIHPTPTPTVGATSTSVPSPYPKVAGTHNGTVHNTNSGQNANLTLALTQHQGKIGGNVTIAAPLSGSGPMTSGFVQKNNYIQFTVQGDNGNAPLLFMGNVQSSGGMSGNYCSIDQSGHCNTSVGGQGTWSVGAITSSPNSSNLPTFLPISNLESRVIV
jgi:eukaryotic-like serine/threonine-protein kinase